MNISIEEMPREKDRLLEENERLEEQLKRYKKREFISKPENINITETLLDTKDSMYQKLSLYSNELEDRIDEKDKEIERLIELCNKYEEEHKTTFEIWQKDIKENEHLRTALNSKESIIKEAIEYIKENKYVSADENCEILAGWRIYELLEILGRAEEE